MHKVCTWKLCAYRTRDVYKRQVLPVSDGVVRIYGLRNAEANELLEFDNGIKAIVMNLEEDNVGAVLLGPTDKIKEGFVVKRTKRIASIRVGEGMLGREMCIRDILTTVQEVLFTGIKVIDLLEPYAKGGKIGLFGGAGVGKTVLIQEDVYKRQG